MLYRLTISNFATIKSFECSFDSGFTVFTGESGAGKSLVFQAIYGLLGCSMNASMIREDADFCELQASFYLKDTTDPILKNYVDEENYLHLYRKVHRNKPGLITINAKASPLKMLKKIGALLAICIGQHEQLSLMKPSHQLDLLDHYIPDLHDLKNQYINEFNHYTQISNELKSISELNIDPQLQEFLSFQIKDISQHNFDSHEEDTLTQQKKDNAKATKQKQHLQQFHSALSSSLQHLQQAKDSLIQLTPTNTLPTLDSVESLSSQLEDLSFTASKEWNNYSTISDQNMNDIESRLDLIFRYSHKYKVHSIHELLEKLESLKTQLYQLDSAEDKKNDLLEDLSKSQQKCTVLAQSISKKRQEHAMTLSKELMAILHQLGFDFVQFKVKFEESKELLTSGMDSINFLISVNAGETEKPIAKVSSGGELSRILLAFYTIFGSFNSHKLLLFDEIDTGVGGLTANAIGSLIHKLSKKQQLFVITHLAQIAQFSNTHIRIEKTIKENETFSSPSILDSNSRQEEMSRMIGGSKVVESILN
ncbi:hypothetical protein DID78_02585 [Candidatus Marinamargulisbacteria bacterium SCGC AG-343-D04]|nr:hypothetical protein DID78_02585 [Candidatus Marinamargulisbacteria bacterium SCGC AG-343-D04]